MDDHKRVASSDPSAASIASTNDATRERKPMVVFPDEVADIGVTLCSYQRAAVLTDKMPPADLSTPILGLFGEVGSVVAAVKKKRRDTAAYVSYGRTLREELGDVLWYFCAIASRAGLDLSILAQRVSRMLNDWDQVEQDEFGSFDDLQSMTTVASEDLALAAMTQLATRTSDLVYDLHKDRLRDNRDAISAHLVFILRALIAVADAMEVSLQEAAEDNLRKVFSRWPIERRYPPRIDIGLPLNERLPSRFTVFIEEHTINGKTYVLQKRNGVIIGDRLTDNKGEKDDYRFHDVFHVAYAVHLGWSPVLRALFRVKRKSHPNLDETEDGSRAVLTEEGIATFVFGRALERDLFADLEHLDYDLLKLVSDLVRGFEPEGCMLWQWERAILDGFRVFRDLKRHRRGYVKADLDAHTLVFEPGLDKEYD